MKMVEATKRTETEMPALAPSERERFSSGGMTGGAVGPELAEVLLEGCKVDTLSDKDGVGAVGSFADEGCGSEGCSFDGGGAASVGADCSIVFVLIGMGGGVVPASCVGVAFGTDELVGTRASIPTALHAETTFSVPSFRSCSLHAASTHDSAIPKMSPVEQ